MAKLLADFNEFRHNCSKIKRFYMSGKEEKMLI